MTKHRHLALLWLCLGLGLLYPAPAGAAESLDQTQTVSQSPATVSFSTQQAQIFTAGLYGWLNRASLRLENYVASPPTGAVLTISVQTVIGGLPSGKQIGSGTIPFSAIPPLGNPGWVDVDLRGAIVAAGTPYALVLQASPWNAHVTWWYAYNSGYARGAMAFHDGTAWRTEQNYDFTFQTYVTLDALDQYQNSSWGTRAIPHTGTMMAQTFTAGLSGVLDRVHVQVADYGGFQGRYLEVSIQTVAGGYPSGTVIGRTSVPASSLPYYPSDGFTIPINAAVSAGTQYAIVLHMMSGYLVCISSESELWGGDKYTGGYMLFVDAGGHWTKYDPDRDGMGPQDAWFETYVATPLAFAPPPPPATITPCSSGICPAVAGIVTATDSTARVTSHVGFQLLPNGIVHGILNFDDSRTGNFLLRGCTTGSAACRLTVTTFTCTDQHAITVAGSYTPKGEDAGYYLLKLSGAGGGIGTFTLTAGHYTYTLTKNGTVEVTCPPGAGVAAGQH